MNYCSIEDAWGKSDYITNQYKKYESKDNIIENFNDINYTINDNKIPEKIIKNNVVLTKKNQKCVFTCDDFINHLQKCSKCRMKINKMFSLKIIEKAKYIIFDNKDTILLILIVLFILLFCNLLYSLTL